MYILLLGYGTFSNGNTSELERLLSAKFKCLASGGLLVMVVQFVILEPGQRSRVVLSTYFMWHLEYLHSVMHIK